MTIKIKSLNLIDRLNSNFDQNIMDLHAQSVKSIQGWRVIEKKTTHHNTIQGGFQSNRSYTVFFLMKTDNVSHIDLNAMIHRDLYLEHRLFQSEGVHYLLIKANSYNKLVIDQVLDYMRSLKNTNDIQFIKQKQDLIFSSNSFTLVSLIDWIEHQHTFDFNVTERDEFDV